MKKFRTPAFIIIAVMSAFWAYILIDTLIREFSKGVTYIDLVAIFVLGFISGICLALVIVPLKKQPEAN